MKKALLPRLCTALLACAAFGLVPQSTRADTWPARTVHVVIPFSPGMGSPDAAARMLADGLGKRWKQAVVVENRPGADTMLATRAFLEMHDGHSLLFTTHSTFTVVPLLHTKVPYDPVGDVRPVSLAVEDFLAVVTAPALGVGALSDFVRLARQKPTSLNFYAVPGAPYLAYLAFQKRAGIETTFVAYNNPTNAMADLSEGRIHIAVMPVASVLGAAQAGKIKILAVTNEQRTPAAPDIPTVKEAGYPEFTFGGFLGLFGPKDMPMALREQIASDVRYILREPDVQERLTTVGLIARGTTPAEFERVMDAQRQRWSAVARDHKIEPQ
ncbi:MAG TPA: tripartite tricarboxylate transporter substrate binding protein [Xanthobacteraceae bacterium]|nr:tripartite tricarboxylate transporter substrate binding protein [Xanthobacteraceae bacterium]